MDRRSYISLVGRGISSGLAGCTNKEFENYKVDVVGEGLIRPWGFTFIPNSSQMLVTERDSGRLTVLDRENGTLNPINGTPNVTTEWQGAKLWQGEMLDVTLHPDFSSKS